MSAVQCWHVCLGFRGRLTDLLFVTRLPDSATVWVALVKQLREEIAISVFVKDQFGLGGCGVGLCVADVKESGSGAVCAADFHHRQIGPVDRVDGVLARRKLGVPGVELKWNVDFKASDDLRMCCRRGKR